MKGKTGYRTGSINGLTGVIGLPEGCARWSSCLLLDRMVSLDYVDSLSHGKYDRCQKKRVTLPLATKAMKHGTKESC